MPGASSATVVGDRFRSIAFDDLPLTILAVAAAAAAVAGREWTERAAPLPWILSLGLVGLPHGAADFACSRRVCRGWTLAVVWGGYLVVMAAATAGFLVAPQAAIVAFTVLSCWHFGAAHLGAAGSSAAASQPDLAATLARGCVVLALPLATWPVATAQTAADLATLAGGRAAAADLFPPAAVRVAGLVLTAVTIVAGAVEALATRRPRSRRARLRLAIELAVIASLGWLTNPLFSVGLYFLVWHGWRQMEPLARSLTGSAPGAWPDLGRAVVRIHAAAVPLLVPAWLAIGATWWWSPGHTLCDLATISIAAYLVVTPAHELLGDLLRAITVRGCPSPARILDGALANRSAQPRQAGRSSHLPMRRNFS